MKFPRESIAVLAAGQDAPEGKEIVRILHEGYRPVESGANYETVYTVAVRDITSVEVRERRAAEPVRASSASPVRPEPETQP